MSDKNHDPNQMTGAAMIVRALVDHGVSTSSAYPAARCFRYDEIFQQDQARAYPGAARAGRRPRRRGLCASTGKPGVVLGRPGRAPPTW